MLHKICWGLWCNFLWFNFLLCPIGNSRLCTGVTPKSISPMKVLHTDLWTLESVSWETWLIINASFKRQICLCYHMYTHMLKIFSLPIPLRAKTKCLTLAHNILFGPTATNPFLQVLCPHFSLSISLFQLHWPSLHSLGMTRAFSCPSAFAHVDSSAQKGLLFYPFFNPQTNVFFRETHDLPQTWSDHSVVHAHSTRHSFFITLMSLNYTFGHCLTNVYFAHHYSSSTYHKA